MVLQLHGISSSIELGIGSVVIIIGTVRTRLGYSGRDAIDIEIITSGDLKLNKNVLTCIKKLFNWSIITMSNIIVSNYVPFKCKIT